MASWPTRIAAGSFAHVEFHHWQVLLQWKLVDREEGIVALHNQLLVMRV